MAFEKVLEMLGADKIDESKQAEIQDRISRVMTRVGRCALSVPAGMVGKCPSPGARTKTGCPVFV